MANNHTNLQATNSDGHTVSVQHTQTDSPILPAANLAELQRIDPSLVPFVMEQTRLEAEWRRKSTGRLNMYVFIERISGVLVGAVIAIFVFAIAGYLILQGHDWAGVGICGSALVAIVGIFVTRKMSEKKEEPTSPKRVPKTRAKKQIPSQIR